MKKIVFAFGLILSILFININVQAQSRPVSAQGKGAIIGGVGGAILGGLIGHDAKGALLGAAVGAGAGYIIGNEHQRNEEKRYVEYRRGYDRYDRGYYSRNRELRYPERVYQTRYDYNDRRVRYVHDDCRR